MSREHPRNRSSNASAEPGNSYLAEWDHEIVTGFVAQHEPFASYWEESERSALSRIDEALPQHCGRLLDLGCGGGRLLGRFAARFDEIVALDSDPARIREAEKAAELANVQNVKFMTGTFNDR